MSVDRKLKESQFGDSTHPLAQSTIDVTLSVLIVPTDILCQLVRHADQLTVRSQDIVADAAWQWWSPTFTVVV